MNPAIFEENLNRLKLLGIQPKTSNRRIVINVHRNHSFEMIGSVLNAFLDLSDLTADVVLSSYDDSLNFSDFSGDIHILWLDLDRYNKDRVYEFLLDRVTVLRSKTEAPILLCLLGEVDNVIVNQPDVFTCNVDSFVKSMGKDVFDLIREKYTGTRLSGMASLECARMLGLKYIPALLKTPFKAVVCDLDNTLYQGILGEDGISALKPNNELQKQIKQLKERGFFICIASKNEEQDVKKMFEVRSDFLLKWEDFTAVQINWDSKDTNIKKLAKFLNIATDAMLFLDDNPAELQNVADSGVSSILVDANICNVLKYYPGLLKLRHNKEDDLRSKDIKANIERQHLQSELSPSEYFEKLKIKLKFSINNLEQQCRVAELLGKTNQFILNYARYNEATVHNFMTSKDKCIITIGMVDKLSDSGVIAILVAHKEKEKLWLDELTVSCRALGRNLENIMLPKLFLLAQHKLQTSAEIFIPYMHGDRNKPALVWLESISGENLQEKGVVMCKISQVIDMTGLQVEID